MMVERAVVAPMPLVHSGRGGEGVAASNRAEARSDYLFGWIRCGAAVLILTIYIRLLKRKVEEHQGARTCGILLFSIPRKHKTSVESKRRALLMRLMITRVRWDWKLDGIWDSE